MKNRIARQTKTVITFILLALVCAAVACAVVWPLWKFATSAPKTYTATVLSAAAALAVIILIKKVRKSSPYKTVKILVSIIIPAAGTALSVKLLFSSGRAAFAAAAAATVIADVIFNIAAEKIHGRKSESKTD